MKIDPKYSEEAEKGLLSSMMQDPRIIGEVVQKINNGQVFVPANQILLNRMTFMWEENLTIDLITLTNYLREMHELDKVGGPSYITEVYGFVPTSVNYAHYIEIIEDKYKSRKATELLQKAVAQINTEADDAVKIIAETSDQLSKIIAVKADRPTFRAMVHDKLERMQAGLVDEDVVTTGIAKLDQHSPLRKGDMPLLTGERKSGKSITALTIMTNVAKKGGKVLYFSLESPYPEVMDRLFAGESRIPMGLHHHTRLNSMQSEAALDAAKKLGEMSIEVRDDVYDLSSIVAVIRQSKDLTLVVADYAQLIRPNLKDSNREQEVAKISRTLRLVAMETKVPIILLSQLNEQGRSRESRSLEQDTTANWNIVYDEDEQNERMIEIPYQRNGESGIRFKVAFLGAIARVENLAYEPKLL